MEKKEYLNEETYQKNKKKITMIALIILIIGILIGGSLIATGVLKQVEVNSKYSEENKISLSEQLENEKDNLETTVSQLKDKIAPIESQIKSLEREPFTGFNAAYFERQDKIEELEKGIEDDKKTISLIENVLDNGGHYCNFDNYKNNSRTSKYCSTKNQLDEISNDFNKSFDSNDSIPFYIFGAFIIIASCMISGSIYMFAKRREILAFSAQQVMPVAQEGIEKMAPTIGKAGASIAKEMAPAYGNIAKEISKGIKEGLKDKEK